MTDSITISRSAAQQAKVAEKNSSGKANVQRFPQIPPLKHIGEEDGGGAADDGEDDEFNDHAAAGPRGAYGCRGKRVMAW